MLHSPFAQPTGKRVQNLVLKIARVRTELDQRQFVTFRSGPVSLSLSFLRFTPLAVLIASYKHGKLRRGPLAPRNPRPCPLSGVVS